MHKEPIGRDYLWVAKSADERRSPLLQVAGTAYGVVVALPPGYPAVPLGAPPSGAWLLYLSSPTAGKQNLLQHATRLTALPAGQVDPTLMGVTGRYALLAVTMGKRRTLELLTLAGRGRGTLRRVGQVAASFGAALAIRGMVLYLGPHGTVHALSNLSGRRSSLSGIAPGLLTWGQKGLMVGADVVRLPGVQPIQQPGLPQGFRWIAVAMSAQRLIAVPQGYTVQEQPGGSSQGVTAKAPDGQVVVSVWQNACAGCYNPGFMAQGTNTLSTPIYVGRHAGTQPIGDHGYLVAASVHGSIQYTRVVDDLDGGDLEASVTVPEAQSALARRILRTLQLPQ